MAEEKAKGKRYYWLKLNEGFFDAKEMKKLRRFAGGDTLAIIYLKMLLVAMKNDGVIQFVGLEDNLAAEIALEIDEEEQNVDVALRFLTSCGMGEILQQGIYLPAAVANTGSEGASAQRVREHRERAKLQSAQLQNALPAVTSPLLEVTPELQSNAPTLQCNNSVTERKRRVRERDREELEKINICADKPQKIKAFAPPTLEEVTDYVEAQGLNVDAQGFIDFYESKGWMVGKSKMKDWKAACRRAAQWESNKRTLTDIRNPDRYAYKGDSF